MTDHATLDLLASGDMEVLGLLPYASNATLLARVRGNGDERLAVYKPRRGERPLWDFPTGTLCLREFAAWVVDRALGWQLVPPTVLRDGPAGYGAVQLFIEEEAQTDPRELLDACPEELKKIAAFDVLVNNADRKAGHFIQDARGHVWSVDHGICFHAEDKLRTVIWVFEGDAVPAPLLRDVGSMRADEDMLAALSELLEPDEVDAFRARVDTLLRTKRFPSAGPGRRHVPWPPW